VTSASVGSGSPDNGAAGAAEDSPSLRADARRNRQRILQAAEALFAEEGVGVPVDDVARRAGVGVGTFYRHFPTKEALFTAVIEAHLERLADEARALSTSEEPGAAFFCFLVQLAEEASSKRNLVEALSGAGINIKTAAARSKEDLESALGVLLARAQHVGAVRADVSLADLMGLVMGACSAAEYQLNGCSRARMIQIVCDGLRGEQLTAVPQRRGQPQGSRH
jgi:AcrR family transcriptional regulator